MSEASQGGSTVNGMEAMAAQVRWVGRNMAYNLTFIPADKLDWHPGPAAKSAFEVVNEAACSLKATLPIFTGGTWQWPEAPILRNLEEVSTLIIESADEYAAALEALGPNDSARTVVLPWGTYPLALAALWPVLDMFHHHGQVFYIQSLLGDAKDHYVQE